MPESTPTFEEAWRLYRKRVYNQCFRMVKNAADAEDLTQDVFVHLHRKIHTFKGDSQFTTWLHTLAKNVVLMKLRRKRGREVSLEELESGGSDDLPLPQYYEAITQRDGRVESTLARVAIEKAIAQMPDGYRLALLLHDFEGMEHEEIAEVLGVSTGSSKSQLFKARNWIAAALGETVRREAEVPSLVPSLDGALAGLEKYLEPEGASHGNTDGD